MDTNLGNFLYSSFIEKQSGATITQRLFSQEALYFIRKQDIFNVDAFDWIGRDYWFGLLSKDECSAGHHKSANLSEAIRKPLLDQFIKELIALVCPWLSNKILTNQNDTKRKELHLQKWMVSIKNDWSYIVETQKGPNVALFI